MSADRLGFSRRVRRASSSARTALEAVLLGLRELPWGAPRASLAQAIEPLLADLSVLAGLDPEIETYFPTIDRVLVGLRGLAEAFAPMGESLPVSRARELVGSCDRALRALREASIDALVALSDRRLRAASDAAGAPARTFQASVTEPAKSVALEGPPRVLVDLSPERDPDDELDAEDALDEVEEDLLSRGPARSPEEALVLEHLRAFCRDCLGDLASLGSLREPLPEMPWLVAEPFEERLLANLDALHALAAEPRALPEAFNVYEEVQRWAREAPVVDRGRELARALVFAGTAGEHALRAVLLTLKQAPPEVHGAYRDGFALSHHPAVPGLMRELLAESDTRLSLLALDVLSALHDVGVTEAAPLASHRDAGVRIAAARALGLSPDRPAAIELLRDCLEDEEDPMVAIAFARSLLRHRRPEGLDWARRALEAEDIDEHPARRLGCLELVALAGGPMDEESALAALGLSPRDARLAGMFGSAAMVPELIDSLGAANRLRRNTGPWVHPLEVAAAAALERITGAGLRDESESVVDYDQRAEPPLAAEVWSAWWRQNEALVPKGRKLRFGRPWEPRLTVSELAGPSRTEVRADLAFELAIATGEDRFDPNDWVARQRAELAAIDERLERWQPGDYPASVLERR